MRASDCLKDFAKYTSLNVAGMIALSCYILADTYFVSKGLGANGLAALNLALPVYSFINGAGLMVGIGGGTIFSIFKSQDEDAAADQTFTNAVMLACSLGLFFFAAGALFSGKIAAALGAGGNVFQMSMIYLRVLLLFAPMFLLNNVLLCFVRNDGSPQMAMTAMITGSLSNVILDYIFIFPLQMGIFGAAFATGLAPIISMGVLAPFFLKKRNSFKLVKCKIMRKTVTNIFSSGLPSLVTELSAGIVMIIFNTLVLGLLGNIGVAAYGVIANLSLIVTAIYTGVAQGIQPLMSASHGAGRRSSVQALLSYALITTFVISGAIYLCVFLYASPIAALFNSEQNALLQSVATDGLKLYFTACPFIGFNVILCVYFTSTERPAPAHMISLLRGFVIIVPAAFLFSYTSAMTGVWCALPATELATAALGLWLYRLHKKTKGDGASYV